MLRKHGVVGKFVEFYGEGVGAVPLANRATIGNMSPEFGSTVRDLPDRRRDPPTTCALTGRSDEQVALVEAYAKEQGLWHDPDHEPAYSEYLELDLSHGRAVASPARSARRTGSRSTDAKDAVPRPTLARLRRDDGIASSATCDEAEQASPSRPATRRRNEHQRRRRDEPPRPGHRRRRLRRPAEQPGPVTMADGTQFELDHGAVVIAAITSLHQHLQPAR